MNEVYYCGVDDCTNESCIVYKGERACVDHIDRILATKDVNDEGLHC
jgi:hypothetical protein